MGWWKIDGPGGGIDWESPCELGGGLVNAIPGKSTPENHYGGDQPADIVGSVADVVKEGFDKRGVKIPRDGLAKVLLNPLASRLVGRMHDKLKRCYEREWGRPPYREEVEAAIQFSIGHLYCEE